MIGPSDVPAGQPFWRTRALTSGARGRSDGMPPGRSWSGRTRGQRTSSRRRWPARARGPADPLPGSIARARGRYEEQGGLRRVQGATLRGSGGQEAVRRSPRADGGPAGLAPPPEREDGTPRRGGGGDPEPEGPAPRPHPLAVGVSRPVRRARGLRGVVADPWSGRPVRSPVAPLRERWL